jgi:hypothetical protein
MVVQHAVHLKSTGWRPPQVRGESMVPFKERHLLKRLLQTPARLILPVALLTVGPVSAAAQQAAAPQQREHVVRRGDTLWDLARAYLNNPFQWRLIYEANRGVVEDPHWIYPAERLIIPPLLQQPAAGEPAGYQPVAAAEPWTAEASAPAAAAQEQQPTVISTVDLRRPVVSTGEYLRLPWLSLQADALLTGRIHGKADPAAADDRMASALYPNTRVHFAMTAGTVAVGDSLLVVRRGRRVGVSGTVVEPLAILRVESTAGAGTGTARIVSQFGDTRVGDAVMGMTTVPAMPEPGVVAQPVEVGVEGQLLEFLVPQPLYGTTDLAFLSVGGSHGVGIGDEFAVYVPAANGMPAEQVAVVRVVRAGDLTSTARVLSVNSVAVRAGLPVRLIRKMP